MVCVGAADFKAQAVWWAWQEPSQADSQAWGRRWLCYLGSEGRSQVSILCPDLLSLLVKQRELGASNSKFVRIPQRFIRNLLQAWQKGVYLYHIIQG